MGKSAGSNQPMKMMLSAEYFTLRYFGQKAINTAAWNENGPQKQMHNIYLIFNIQREVTPQIHMTFNRLTIISEN